MLPFFVLFEPIDYFCYIVGTLLLVFYNLIFFSSLLTVSNVNIPLM